MFAPRRLLLVLVASAACHREVFDDERPPHVEMPQAEYSYAARIVARLPLSGADNTGSPVHVGLIHGMSAGQDGRLYALDLENKNIVVFDLAGHIVQVLGNGYGRGQGQFASLDAVTVRPNGDVYVVDDQLHRITKFDATGAVRETIPVPVREAFGVAVRDSFAWVLQKYRNEAGQFAVAVLTPHGIEAGAAFPVSRREKDFANIFPGALGTTRDGSILFAHPQPGVWSAMTPSGMLQKLGTDLMPSRNVAFERTGSRAWRIHGPGGSIAIGGIGASKVAILFATQFLSHVKSPDGDRIMPSVEYYIAVYSREGRYLGATKLSGIQLITAAAFDEQRGWVYLAEGQPETQLLRVALDERRLPAAAGDGK